MNAQTPSPYADQPSHVRIMKEGAAIRAMKAGDFVFYNDGKAKESTPVRIVWISRQLEQAHALFPSDKTEVVSSHLLTPWPRYGVMEKTPAPERHTADKKRDNKEKAARVIRAEGARHTAIEKLTVALGRHVKVAKPRWYGGHEAEGRAYDNLGVVSSLIAYAAHLGNDSGYTSSEALELLDNAFALCAITREEFAAFGSFLDALGAR